MTAIPPRRSRLVVTSSAGMLALAALLGIAGVAAVDDRAPATTNPTLADDLGTIDFAVSGDPAAQAQVVHGVKLLHHMMYEEADRSFAAAVATDPQCLLAHWGRAMAVVTPLWTDTTPARLAEGLAHVERARQLSGGTPRERAYLGAMEAYFRDASTRPERVRLESTAAAWRTVMERFPEDLDARTFYALYSLAPARFAAPDQSQRVQLRAGQILEGVLARIPDHPGAHHYRIHAYDSPLLAGRALELCGDYGKIAPEVPHALHMPSHIFTRRGEWTRSIEFNLRSVEAARVLGAQTGATSSHYTHGSDYLVYAYLQRGQYREAEAVRDRVLALQPPFSPTNLRASAYALAAIPARCALERHAWAAAAALQPRQPAQFPWTDADAPYVGIVVFARTLGAIRSGDVAAARAGLKELTALRDQIATQNQRVYWTEQAGIQILTGQAWLELRTGNIDAAVALMRDAAAREAATDKEPVTPGEVLPAGELLGDMLHEVGRPADALAAYEAMLAIAPNRLNSLHGAARAAEAAGDRTRAGELYRRVLEMTAAADDGTPSVIDARNFLAATQVSAAATP